MALTSTAAAEVSTDGSLGRKVTRTARDVTVEHTLGRRRGGNLFHSFDRFGVPTGGSVTFTGPGGIDNVVSRVTGGERSDIDGVLRSRIPGADFYLVNPAGIVFGPNASLDVSGSFHASTADELRFGDGAVFAADLDGGGSRLSMAEPRAFGFLGGRSPTTITVNRTNLRAAAGGDVSLVAGDIAIQGAGSSSATMGGVGSAGGRLLLVAQGRQGEVDLGSGDVSSESTGALRLSDAAQLAQFSDGGEGAVVRAGELELSGGSSIFGVTLGSADAGDLALTAGSIIVDGQSFIATSTREGDTGRGADLRIEADRLAVLNGSAIAALPGDNPAARGGAIDIQADAITISGGPSGRLTGIFNFPTAPNAAQAQGAGGPIDIVADGLISVRSGGAISTATAGPRDGGSINLRAGRLLVSGSGSRISSSSISLPTSIASGRGGDINVVSRGEVRLVNGGTLSSTSQLSLGDAGAISVDAADLIVSGEGSQFPTGIDVSSNSSFGDAGSITVTADRIRIVGPASPTSLVGIHSDTSSPRDIGSGNGNAGTITVTAKELLELRGNGQVSSVTSSGDGDAGVVTVNAQDLIISGDSAAGFADFERAGFTGITSSALRGSLGDAGSVNVTADRIEIARRDAGDRAGITSDTFGVGNAGDVTIVSREFFEIRDGGAVSSSTFAQGNAGKVSVTANDLLINADGYDENGTGIFSQAEPASSGNAGEVFVRADDVELRGGGEIASSTFSTGKAGSVSVLADDVLVSSDGFETFVTGILSQANPESSGNAGTTVVVARGDLEVRGENGQITSKSLGSGGAGGVAVSADRVSIEDGGSITSQSTSGEAGAVLVLGDEVSVDNASIRTSSEGFVGGQVQITASELISLKDSVVTTSGEQPAAGASLITLEAPFIVLNDSRVESLTGDGQPLQDSGEANLIGDVTVISSDSVVAGSSAVEIAGLQQNLGSGLQVAPGAFLDAGRLLRASCASRGAARSSFTAGGRGGLPPAPDRPLGSLGAGAGTDRAGASGSFDVACASPMADGR